MLKAAYAVRMSDWSSDVCSSDLLGCSLLCLGLIAVIMIMVMTAAGAVNMPVLISLNRSFQFLTAYRAFSDFRLVEQEVDDLVLIKRRAKLGCGHWLLLDILDEALAILGDRTSTRLNSSH